MDKTISSIRYKNLIDFLKRSRLERKETMRSLSVKLKQPHTFVHKVESLERRLDVYEYVQYCNALGVDPCKGINKFLKNDSEY